MNYFQYTNKNEISLFFSPVKIIKLNILCYFDLKNKIFF